ncbi:hypothetical protein EAF00_000717 [Botryotinia globosa]|nr:hypothetical protein EAF00_000717 [Botryotinia globosa]
MSYSRPWNRGHRQGEGGGEIIFRKRNKRKDPAAEYASSPTKPTPLEPIRFDSRHPFRFLHNALLNTYAEAPDDEYSSEPNWLDFMSLNTRCRLAKDLQSHRTIAPTDNARIIVTILDISSPW